MRTSAGGLQEQRAVQERAERLAREERERAEWAAREEREREERSRREQRGLGGASPAAWTLVAFKKYPFLSSHF